MMGPILYEYTPQPDITAYELALIVPFLVDLSLAYKVDDMLKRRPELAKHFTEQA